MDPCAHLDQADPAAEPSSTGCEDCLRSGGTWMHLRMCRTCGHVGCCDNSPGRHATGHHQSTGHPLISTYEPGEDWWWCYPEEIAFELPDLPDYAHP